MAANGRSFPKPWDPAFLEHFFLSVPSRYTKGCLPDDSSAPCKLRASLRMGALQLKGPYKLEIRDISNYPEVSMQAIGIGAMPMPDALTEASHTGTTKWLFSLAHFHTRLGFISIFTV